MFYVAWTSKSCNVSALLLLQTDEESLWLTLAHFPCVACASLMLLLLVFVFRVTSLLLCGRNKLRTRRERATDSWKFFVKIILWLIDAQCCKRFVDVVALSCLHLVWEWIYFTCKDVLKDLFMPNDQWVWVRSWMEGCGLLSLLWRWKWVKDKS